MEADSRKTPSGYLVDTFEGLKAEFTDFEELSRSEYNVVVRAKRYGRWWVLKGLLPEFAALESHQQMLRKEFEVMMSLQHPFVVQAFEIEQVEALGLCIVMEYVDGPTLGDWLETQPAVAARRRIADCLIEAVGYAHINGVVHRDLKPSNVIVTGNGSGVKLIDFGLADTESHAVLKQPAGTPGYMSPEQMEQFSPDVRNDIYSLGIVLREMDLGRYYKKVIARCLASVDHRYATVDDLRRGITAATTWRHRWLAALAAIGLLALAVGLWWITAKSPRPVSTADTEALRVELAAQQSSQKALSDSLARLASENDRLRDAVDKQQQEREQERRQELEHSRQRLDQAIARGRNAVDLAAARSGITAHLDTLSDASRLDALLLGRANKAVKQAALDYMLSIKRDFATDELEAIRKEMETYINAVHIKWVAKINSL